MEEEVVSLREEKRRGDDRVQTLQAELSKISQQSAARGALEELKKEKRARGDAYQSECVCGVYGLCFTCTLYL